MMKSALVLLLLPAIAGAQQRLNLTVNAGFSNYSGDLQEKRFTIDQSNFSFGAGLSYELFPKFLIRGELQYAKLGADDKKSPRQSLRERNLNFQTTVIEGSFLADYSLFDLRAGKKMTPYVFAGVALFHFNPYTHDAAGTKYFLRNLNTEGQTLPEYPDKKKYLLVQYAIPFGGGIRFRITENTYLGYEIGLRKLFTDYIDDVSTTYADHDVLLAARGAKAVELAYRTDEIKADAPYPPVNTVRGSPKYKDWYYFSTIKLSIGILNETGKLFGKKVGRGSVDCPRM
ncbi:MAG: outer membrane beta-barrel protein [Chitinophagaceae bacterium]|nr:outer membrane beta-barrel protein [Chitinophagaceae bacterium]